MRRITDAEGRRFGRTVIVRRTTPYVSPVGNEAPRFICKCDCGEKHVARWQHLRAGRTKSCGCLNSELSADRKRTHGKTADRGTYKSWSGMRERCQNPKHKSFPRYGGRGITVCPRWNSFENFLSDMGDSPSPEHSIERKNNDGNYDPGNCKWATRAEQCRNRRSTIILEFNGERLCATDWAHKTGKHPRLIHARLRRGWTPYDAVFKPLKAA